VCVLWNVGCDLVNWLHTHVQGLSDRREARKYAAAMLHAGLIRHTVNKTTFSDQCYYTLGDFLTSTTTTTTNAGTGDIVTTTNAGNGDYRQTYYQQTRVVKYFKYKYLKYIRCILYFVFEVNSKCILYLNRK